MHLPNAVKPSPIHLLSHRARAWAVAAALVLMAVALAACGGRAEVDEAELPTPVPTIAPFATPVAVQPAPTPTAVPTPTEEPVDEEPEIEELLEEEPPVDAEEPAAEDIDVEADADADPEAPTEADEEADAIDEAEEVTEEAAGELDEEAIDDEETVGEQAIDDEQEPAEDAVDDAADEVTGEAGLVDEADDVDAVEEDEAGDVEAADVEIEAADAITPTARFLQPTHNAIVPLTLTVHVTVEGVSIRPVEVPTEPDADTAVETEAELDDATLDEDAATVEDADEDAVEGADEDAVENGEETANGADDAPDAADSSFEQDGDETTGDETNGDEVNDADEAATDADEATADQAGVHGEAHNDVVEPVEADVDMDEPATNDLDELNGEDLDDVSDELDAEDAAYLFILVNQPLFEAGETIPVPASYIVPVGEGGIAQLTLAAGTHRLSLQFADEDFTARAGDPTQAIIVAAQEGAAAQAVRIAMPTDGAVVPPEFDVVMAATGLTVEPIGVARPDAGHFHILIDEDFLEPGEIIPADATNLHFGAGQLTTTVSLEPGVYTLRLQLADGLHAALDGDAYRDEITVTVVEDAPPRQVMFITPQDGDEVASPFPVRWAAAGLIVEPIGPIVDEGRGHFHVLVDEDFVAAGEVIPTSATQLHFGAAQMETELTLEPGEYTLRLQMANGAHIAFDGDEYRDEIAVTVLPDASDDAMDGSEADAAETDTETDTETDADTDAAETDTADTDEPGSDSSDDDSDDTTEDNAAQDGADTSETGASEDEEE